MSFDPNMKLSEANDKVLDAIVEGEKIVCPCCDRPVNVRTESLNWIRVHMLIAFCNHNPVGWMKKDDINALFLKNEVVDPKYVGSGDFAKNAYWGLIEEETMMGEDYNDMRTHTGRWRMTDQGRDFVDGKIAINPSMRYYNRTFIGWTKRPPAMVHELINRDFSLSDTMTPAPLRKFFKKPVDESEPVS